MLRAIAESGGDSRATDQRNRGVTAVDMSELADLVESIAKGGNSSEASGKNGGQTATEVVSAPKGEGK